MYKVMSAMDRILGHVKEHRKQEFLCAIMQAIFSFMLPNSTENDKNIQRCLILWPFNFRYYVLEMLRSRF